MENIIQREKRYWLKQFSLQEQSGQSLIESMVEHFYSINKFLSLPYLQIITDLRSTDAYKLGPETPLSYFGMAMMGEGGELCNLLAKLERAKMGAVDGGNSIKVEDITKEKLAEEAGGLLIYLAILLKRAGIDLEEAVIKTFNDKSTKLGYPVLLEKASLYKQDEKDIVIAGLEEGCDNWESEYKQCRRILQELVDLKLIKDTHGNTPEYLAFKPKAWQRARDFLQDYTHI